MPGCALAVAWSDPSAPNRVKEDWQPFMMARPASRHRLSAKSSTSCNSGSTRCRQIRCWLLAMGEQLLGSRTKSWPPVHRHTESQVNRVEPRPVGNGHTGAPGPISGRVPSADQHRKRPLRFGDGPGRHLVEARTPIRGDLPYSTTRTRSSKCLTLYGRWA
jgi:hypothetical protein